MRQLYEAFLLHSTPWLADARDCFLRHTFGKPIASPALPPVARKPTGFQMVSWSAPGSHTPSGV